MSLGWVVVAILGSTLVACSPEGPGGPGRPPGEDAGGGTTPPPPPPPPGGCRTDADCPGEVCSGSGACIPAGSCAVDADCMEGYRCDVAASACMLGSACGAEEFVAEPVLANFLIVLDRSCSMRQPAAGVPKWTAAVEALTQLTTEHEEDVRWGLTLFPDKEGSECAQDGVWPVAVGDGQAPAIRMILSAALAPADRFYPQGPCVTNIDTAMEQAEAEPAFTEMDRQGYVMLVTDGKQSDACRDGRDDRTYAAIDRLLGRGVRTFVVGFGGDEIDPRALSEFARRGGTARMADPPYYQADDPTELAAALGEIVGSVLSCSYRLAEPPPDTDAMYVFFDDSARIDRDPMRTEGWDYDPATQTVTFYGEACDQLRRGDVTDVDVVFGCPEPTLD